MKKTLLTCVAALTLGLIQAFANPADTPATAVQTAVAAAAQAQQHDDADWRHTLAKV